MASSLHVKKEFELSPGLSLSTSTSTSTKSPVSPLLNKRVEAMRQQEEEGRKRPNPSQDPNPNPNPNPACYGLPTLPVLPLQFVPAFDPYTGFPCIVPFPVGLVPHLPIQLPPTPNDPLVRRLHSWPPPPEPYSHSHQEINISDIGGGSSNSNSNNSSSRKDSNHNTEGGKRQKLIIQTGKLSQVPSENSISSEANQEGGVSTGANENIVNVRKLDVTIRNNKVLPLVSTKGNGRTVYGYLNSCKRINNGVLGIVCNCHGISFSPAEFVRHAGGPETVRPLKHINVVMSNPSRRS
ncbi:hypothetical protein J5N97_007263 [Dioscorea zingiberensis]|uniref:Ninja-family protein n=1 Tax=Dioscorea zingiberensis TaxID=325984 RepID=A0A9D5HUZ8_9LILI|nr:hypothetical protein J5N97_007263 [Dioscorea zingiberensis]